MVTHLPGSVGICRSTIIEASGWVALWACRSTAQASLALFASHSGCGWSSFKTQALPLLENFEMLVELGNISAETDVLAMVSQEAREASVLKVTNADTCISYGLCECLAADAAGSCMQTANPDLSEALAALEVDQFQKLECLVTCARGAALGPEAPVALRRCVATCCSMLQHVAAGWGGFCLSLLFVPVCPFFLGVALARRLIMSLAGLRSRT